MSTKSCEIVQQIEFLPYDLNEFENLCKNLKNIKEYSFIVHNKDLNENNELKKPHIHCVIVLSESSQFSTIANHFNLPVQCVNKILSSIKAAKAYLIHLNQNDKYHYEPTEVISNIDFVGFIDKLDNKLNKKQIAQKIYNGEIKEYNLFNYISIEDFAQNKTFYSRCFEFRQNLLSSNNRDLKCYFISGQSGYGKTLMAKKICKDLNYSCYISSSGKSLFDDYKGQDVIILDDLRPTHISFSDLLKISDNNTNSLVGCRYYNKSIFECKMLIITCSLSINQFVKQFEKCDLEDFKQFYRRFNNYIVIDKNINFYLYLNDYNLLCSYKNTLLNEFENKLEENASSLLTLAAKMDLVPCAENIKFEPILDSEELPF